MRESKRSSLNLFVNPFKSFYTYVQQKYNTIELVLPSAHESPQPKRQIDRFSRFCRAH